jgi:hypothetical protein
MGIKSGVPGGCGIPKQADDARYSPQSQSAMVGDAVKRYTTEEKRKTKNARIAFVRLCVNIKTSVKSKIWLLWKTAIKIG